MLLFYVSVFRKDAGKLLLNTSVMMLGGGCVKNLEKRLGDLWQYRD